MSSNIMAYRALDKNVLVVAVKRVEGTWCAYIKNVIGDSHNREKEQVARYGSKLSEIIALAIFPRFTSIPYAW